MQICKHFYNFWDHCNFIIIAFCCFFFLIFACCNNFFITLGQNCEFRTCLLWIPVTVDCHYTIVSVCLHVYIRHTRELKCQHVGLRGRCTWCTKSLRRHFAPSCQENTTAYLFNASNIFNVSPYTVRRGARPETPFNVPVISVMSCELARARSLSFIRDSLDIRADSARITSLQVSSVVVISRAIF